MEVCDIHPEKEAIDCHGGEIFLCGECWPAWVQAFRRGVTPDQFIERGEERGH